MKIFGFHIVHEDIVNLYAKKCAEVMELDKAINRKIAEYNKVNGYYQTLQKRNADLSAMYEQQRDDVLYRDDLIKDLKAKVEDLKSSNTELSERFEKEQSDNCELQNLYSEKCKECEELQEYAKGLSAECDRIEADKKAIEDKFEKHYGIYEREGYVVVKEDFYSQVLTDAEKFREEREKHNANRRKRRAAKKVAQGKPGD